MGVLDWIFLVCLLVGTVVGCIRGLLKQVISFATTIIVIIGTSYLFVYPDVWLQNLVTDGTFRTILSIVVTALAIFAVCKLFSFLLRKAVRSFRPLKWLDIVFGGFLGFVIAYMSVASVVGVLLNAADSSIASISEALQPQIDGSWMITNIFSQNLFGNWVGDIVKNAIAAYFPSGS